MCIFGISVFYVMCVLAHIDNTGYVDCNDVIIHCPYKSGSLGLPMHLGALHAFQAQNTLEHTQVPTAQH